MFNHNVSHHPSVDASIYNWSNVISITESYDFPINQVSDIGHLYIVQWFDTAIDHWFYLLHNHSLRPSKVIDLWFGGTVQRGRSVEIVEA